MIRPLRQPFHDPEVNSGVKRGGLHNLAEQNVIHRPGTGEREQFSAGPQKFHGQQIDVLVSARGLFLVRVAFGEFRRVQHDQVEGFPGIPTEPQILKNIGADHFKSLRCTVGCH
ncbi:hypothetical protein SDC9_212611 [bioreactor metagenome]|uniref:Uncharacterized protein n=1 Tax=bioreactor metagenome TaxID=1076179 RepID=A0A645JZN3_9ZZZZ